MTKKIENLTFEELTLKTGKVTDVWYIAQEFEVPLQASKTYWMKHYNIDPTKSVVKRTKIIEKD